MLLLTPRVTAAVSAIPLRADTTPDQVGLRETFVDTGVLPLLQTPNHGVLFGRRGTGKSHLLSFVEVRMRSQQRCVCNIDLRRLGSSSQFTDTRAPLPERCLALFRDLLYHILGGLSSHLSRHPTLLTAEVQGDLRTFSDAIDSPPPVVTKSQRETETTDEGNSQTQVKASLSGISLGASQIKGTTKRTKQTSALIYKDHVVFPVLAQALDEVLTSSGLQMYLLLDEWSSIPIDLQPYLAEFLKRTFIPSKRVVIKIAAIEFRSQFYLPSSASPIGLELGGDLFHATTLDDFYAVKQNFLQLASEFVTVLHRHIEAELRNEPGPQGKPWDIATAADLLEAIDAEERVFRQMLLASEGNLRDFLQIFAGTYALDYQKRAKALSLSSLEQVAERVSTNKTHQLPEPLHPLLERIISVLVDKVGSRYFVLPSRSLSREAVQLLLDHRLVHIVERDFVTTAKPGARFAQLALDYGLFLPYLRERKLRDTRPVPGAPTKNDDSIRRSIERTTSLYT
jgi:hypothetical protein